MFQLYVCLCRLLGPAAQTLSASQVLASSFRDTRVVVMDNGLGIFAHTNQEEEQIDYVVRNIAVKIQTYLKKRKSSL